MEKREAGQVERGFWSWREGLPFFTAWPEAAPLWGTLEQSCRKQGLAPKQASGTAWQADETDKGVHVVKC